MVAVGDEPDRLVPTERRQQLHAGLFQGHDADADGGPCREDVALDAGVGDRFHRGNDRAKPMDGEEAGQLDRAEMQADEDQRPALGHPGGDFVGRFDERADRSPNGP